MTNDPQLPNARIIRLPRNGPKPGQSTEAWLYGKSKWEQKEMERARWKELKKKGAISPRSSSS